MRNEWTRQGEPVCPLARTECASKSDALLISRDLVGQIKKENNLKIKKD
jgi:hypothetical protein